MGIEEPFVRFAARAILGGGDRSKLYALPDASSFAIPKDIGKLREQIVRCQASLVYFDSIYSHFATRPSDNAAERARKCLGPLAELAQSTGCTVVAAFHENKCGDYLGSTEMRNVPRYLLKATRDAGRPLRLSVDKTNLFDPGFAMQFEATDDVFRDPATNQVQYEEKEDGSTEPMMIKVLHRGENLTGLNLEEIDTTQTERDGSIIKLLQDKPDISSNEIIRRVGGKKAEMLPRIRSIRQALAVPTEPGTRL